MMLKVKEKYLEYVYGGVNPITGKDFFVKRFKDFTQEEVDGYAKRYPNTKEKFFKTVKAKKAVKKTDEQ